MQKSFWIIMLALLLGSLFGTTGLVGAADGPGCCDKQCCLPGLAAHVVSTVSDGELDQARGRTLVAAAPVATHPDLAGDIILWDEKQHSPLSISRVLGIGNTAVNRLKIDSH